MARRLTEASVERPERTVIADINGKLFVTFGAGAFGSTPLLRKRLAIRLPRWLAKQEPSSS